MVPSLSSISRGHLCVDLSFFIPFPHSSAAFVTSSELSDLIWYSSDLMECTFFTSSTIARLSAQTKRASWDQIFAFLGRCVFSGWFIDLIDTTGDYRWLIMMQCLSLATLVDLTGVRFGWMQRVLYRIVFLLPNTVFQIYNSAGNRPDSKCVCKIAWPVVMSLSSNWLFIWDSKHPRIQMLAACSSTCSF